MVILVGYFSRSRPIVHEEIIHVVVFEICSNSSESVDAFLSI